MSFLRYDAPVRIVATVCAAVVVMVLVVAIALVPQGKSCIGAVANGNNGPQHCISLNAAPAFQLASTSNDLKSIFGYPVRQEAVSEALARNRIDMLLLIPSYTVFFLLLFADGFGENRLLKICALIMVIGVAILDFTETGTQIKIANLLQRGKTVPQGDLIDLFYASRAKLVALGVLNIFVCITAWNNGLSHGRFRLAAMFGASGTILFAFLLWKYGAHWFFAFQGCLSVGWFLAFILALKQLGDIHISPNGKGEGQS